MNTANNDIRPNPSNVIQITPNPEPYKQRTPSQQMNPGLTNNSNQIVPNNQPAQILRQPEPRQATFTNSAPQENETKNINQTMIKVPSRGYDSGLNPEKHPVLPVVESKKAKTGNNSTHIVPAKQKGKKSNKGGNKNIVKINSEPVSQYFNRLRRELMKKSEEKKKAIDEEYRRDLEELNKTEKFVIEQIMMAEGLDENFETESMKSQPVDFQEDASVESDRFSSTPSKEKPPLKPNTTIPNDSKVLINSFKNSTYITLDLSTSQKIELPVLPNGSSRLFHAPDQVLIYNSVTQEVSSMHLISRDLKIISRLNSNRRFCTFGYINNFPAVMGGLDPNSNSLSREVDLIDGLNTSKKFSMLVNPRSHGLSTVFKGKTFIFGGNPPNVNKIIEKFDGSTWTALSINLPVSLSQFAIIPAADTIIVLGGINNENKQKVNTIIAVDPVRNTLKYNGFISFNFLAGDCMNAVWKEGTLYLIDYETGHISRQNLPNL
jgi:hypothetical protein